MRLLLDTHAFIWFLYGDAQLSKKARLAIQDLDSICFLSIASLWEISIKQSIGKLELSISDDRLLKWLAVNEINILPIHLNHALKVKNLPFHHRDPFDRMLIAQSMVDNLTLISADGEFSKYDVSILW